ncbi:glycosyltransferase family 4 protein [Geobacter sp. SVR]|uniref:glycosyltransferase family 4 protein n=1 Tax=Geobacter sp. SVR TaxID=2495594 RepID=UPI00143EF544|nr:glycosyltransferase family 4 protein [Geobacter sp. SVR]BCS52549.1 glycosyl transferase [Geobacter sp. SVR]GCF84013.1 glycosyl transferase [Geobacter sp. SVR]
MRIAQVSPLHERVPPLLYGGTERIVSYLTEELVRQGHDVTLFASGDSITTARLVPCSRNSLRMDESCIDPIPHHLLMLERVFRMAGQFDIIHFHIDYFHFSMSRRHHLPHVTTLHGRLNIPDLVPLYQEYSEVPVISISDSQRAPLPWLNWLGTVHHGLPKDLLSFNPKGGDYLAFLGRISPEKGVDAAIEIARQSGIPLKIAAKIDKANHDYYENMVKPRIDGHLVEYLGEIGEKEKPDFLGNALALIFPIDWEEPFGLVMIESMACGTPVIAFARGSVPEVIRDGVSGFLANDVQEAVQAAKSAASLSRQSCRSYFEKNFSASRMAEDYLAVYRRLVSDANRPPARCMEKVSATEPQRQYMAGRLRSLCN